jgi:hypothetical protein
VVIGVTVEVMVTLLSTIWVDVGLAEVTTLDVPLPTADADDVSSSAIPATTSTDAAPIETTERNLL